jgi:hypothetical protein
MSGAALTCRRVTRECLVFRASPGRPYSNHDVETNIAAMAGSPTLYFPDRARLHCLGTLALTMPRTSDAMRKRGQNYGVLLLGTIEGKGGTSPWRGDKSRFFVG